MHSAEGLRPRERLLLVEGEERLANPRTLGPHQRVSSAKQRRTRVHLDRQVLSAQQNQQEHLGPPLLVRSSTFNRLGPSLTANPIEAGGDAVGPVTTGSSNPPYAPFSEKETPTSNNMIAYQSISCMPAYKGTSFEASNLSGGCGIISLNLLYRR